MKSKVLHDTDKLFKSSIEEGSILEKTYLVTSQHLASTLGIGRFPLLSTASLIGFMEHCCVELVDADLLEGLDTVSAEMNVKHLHPAKEGEELTCRACLKYIEKNKLFFDVALINQKGFSIALGAHERIIVDHQAFMGR